MRHRWLFTFVCLLLPSSLLAPQPAEAQPANPGEGCGNPPAHLCAPKHGVPVPFRGDHDQDIRVRKSIWDLSSAEINELKAAFAAFRALPETDPRSWAAMANIHCWHCASPDSRLGLEPAPEDVHATWAFLPFHRNYLYTLEKVLGKLVGNPRFALPYWDWDSPDGAACNGSHQQLPLPYLGVGNPLWDCNRGVTPEQSMCAAIVGNRRLSYILSTYDTFPLFFGTEQCGSVLWHGAHGYLHIWAGGLKNTTSSSGAPITVSAPDMGMLGTAAFDPLFYAHHANVDRLWDLWLQQNGPVKYPRAFLDQSWTFWNQDNVLVRMTAEDAANRTERLHYRYAKPSCGGPTQLMEDVTGPPRAPAANQPRYTLNGKTGSKVVLHLENLQLPGEAAAVLRVYVNSGGDSNTRTCSEDNVPVSGLPEVKCPADNLVEELFIVGKALQASTPTNSCANLVVCTRLAEEITKAGGKARVSVVPVGLDSKGATGGSVVGIHPSFKEPYFTVEE